MKQGYWHKNPKSGTLSLDDTENSEEGIIILMHNTFRCIFIHIYAHTWAHTYTLSLNSLVRAGELNTHSKHFFLQHIIMQYSYFLCTTLSCPTSPEALGVFNSPDTA